MWPFELGKPDAASVIVAIPFVVWLRPVIRQDRVGEQRAVVWKFVYTRPCSAIPVDVRRLDHPAERLHGRKPDVVEDDVEHARSALGRDRLRVGLPVRDRLGHIDVDDALERLGHQITLPRIRTRLDALDDQPPPTHRITRNG
jgi:hypothetical protein